MSSMKVGLEKMAPPPGEREALPCPRCQSSNTKFCYYNNYNFSQPRYFCKSCRRYWTRGGTLRDVPVGGGSRKSAKRSRTASPATTPSTTPTTTGHVQSNTVYPVQVGGVGGGGFTSLLALGGFGLGLGMEEVRYGFGGYGLGSAGWNNYGAVCGGGGGETWQMGGGGGGGGGCSCAECFTTSLPELAISTPGYGLK